MGEDNGMLKMIQSLETEISKLKGKGGVCDVEEQKRQCTAVLGGLTTLGSKDIAETWVYDKLYVLYGPKPKFVESRGDFRGIVFAQFDSVEDRDIAMKLLKASGCKEGGNAVWAKRDEKLTDSVIRSLVMGTKWLLDKSVWVEPETGIVSVGSE